MRAVESSIAMQVVVGQTAPFNPRHLCVAWPFKACQLIYQAESIERWIVFIPSILIAALLAQTVTVRAVYTAHFAKRSVRQNYRRTLAQSPPYDSSVLTKQILLPVGSRR